MTQPYQIHGFSLSDHINSLEKYLGKNVIDYVIANSKKPPRGLLERYEKRDASLVKTDKENIKNKLIETDIIEDRREIKRIWEKQDLLRHDPDKIAEVIISLSKKTPKIRQ